MMSYSDRTQADLLDQVVKTLRGKGSPEQRIDQALALLGHEPSFSKSPRTGAKTLKLRPLLIGKSPVMHALHGAIERIARTPATVLVRGESGTGKELVARSIHVASLRSNHPFVVVHCAAVPETLIEATLFGHERGAFTGAHQRKKGRLELAVGGTLFLDEVGDIPLSTQVKLLRVLQEKEYERVGGSETIPTDIRVIAATHRNLEAMVKTGEFREDLYYRLNVVPIHVPPLRERREDIPLFIAHFLPHYSAKMGYAPKTMNQDAIDALTAYAWPGNVRELKNIIERLVIMVPGETITRADVPHPLAAGTRAPSDSGTNAQIPEAVYHCGTLKEARRHFERSYIERKLRENEYHISRTAEALGMERTSLHRKIKDYGIATED